MPVVWADAAELSSGMIAPAVELAEAEDPVLVLPILPDAVLSNEKDDPPDTEATAVEEPASA